MEFYSGLCSFYYFLLKFQFKVEILRMQKNIKFKEINLDIPDGGLDFEN